MVMSGKKSNARLLERIFMLVSQVGEMRTDRIHEAYETTYGNPPRLANMTQTLLSSGLFKRVGWYDRVDDLVMRTEKSSKQLGLHSARYVCVVQTKTMEEIIEKYIGGKTTPLRRLESMPAFVRYAVKEAGDSQ